MLIIRDLYFITFFLPPGLLHGPDSIHAPQASGCACDLPSNSMFPLKTGQLSKDKTQPHRGKTFSALTPGGQNSIFQKPRTCLRRRGFFSYFAKDKPF